MWLEESLAASRLRLKKNPFIKQSYLGNCGNSGNKCCNSLLSITLLVATFVSTFVSVGNKPFLSLPGWYEGIGICCNLHRLSDGVLLEY